MTFDIYDVIIFICFATIGFCSYAILAILMWEFWI